MTSGGFEYGDNTVAARLSIDIPTESVGQLRELVGEIDKFRTSAEQATRGSDNFNRYLQGMAESGMRAVQMHQQLAQAMERTLHLQERLGMASGGAMATGVPQGTFQQPFQPNQLGMGMSRHPSNIQESTRLLENLAQQNPRHYVNFAAQHGGLSGGQGMDLTQNTIGNLATQISSRERQAMDEEMKVAKAASPLEGGAMGRAADMAQRVGPGMRMAHSLLNEMGPGGTNLGVAGLTSHMMGMAGAYMKGRSKAAEAGAGGADGPQDSEKESGVGAILGKLGPLGKGLGMAGGILGAVLGGLGLINKGGEMIQGFHNVGAIRGGGAWEGVQYEAQARMMALNPFITTEQSRQVIQAGLSAGYSKDSKQWDSATDFIKNNLIDMNMSIGESFKLLRTNAQEGGSSVDDISKNLKETFKWVKENPDSLLNFKDLAKTQEDISAALIKNGGVSGNNALAAGGMFAEAFAKDPVLRGLGGSLGTAAANGGLDQLLQLTAGATGLKYTADDLAGGLYNSLAETPDHGAAQVDAALKALVQMARTSSVGPKSAGRNLQQMAQQYGIQLDRTQADKLVAEDNVPFPEAAGSGGSDNAVPGGSGGAGTSASSMRGGIIDQLNSGFGQGGWDVVDGDGNAKDFNPQDEGMVRDLQSGKLQYRRKGQSGGGTSLGDMPSMSGSGDDGGQQGAPNQMSAYSSAGTSMAGRTGGPNTTFGGGGGGATTVNLTYDKGLFGPSQVQIAPQEAQANKGWGAAQTNMPDPSTGYTMPNGQGTY